MDRLLTVDHAGELLNTGPRFVRRLIAERRIEFVHVGRHVCNQFSITTRRPDPSPTRAHAAERVTRIELA
jgi:excisionase family DNA binding protein